MARSQTFRFDGGAGTYLGTGILALLVTVLSFGIATPFAIVLHQRWRAKHTYVNGHRLVFLGTGTGLFFSWLKWLALTVVTFGIYGFWVMPRVQRWIVENTDFDPAFTPGPAFAAAPATSELTAGGEAVAIPDSEPATADPAGT